MDQKIIIFDGVCNFCNASINFIMDRDRNNVFKFTANQHEAGGEILAGYGKEVSDVSTVYLLEEGKLYDRSTAALRIARHLSFPYPLLYVLMIVPRFLRDAVYKWIANNRYKWFGKRDACRLPTPEERAKFL